jgi:hypothetical protein
MSDDTSQSSPADLPKLSRRKTFQWRWEDQEKARELLRGLRQHNSDLWSCLPPQHESLLEQGETAWILPGMSRTLSLRMADEADSDMPNNGVRNLLAVCTSLRKACLQLEQVPSVPMHEVKPAGLTVNRAVTVGRNRFLGKLDGANVIVEVKSILSTMSVEDQALSRKRLLALMKLLARRNHPSLRLLRGIFVYREVAAVSRPSRRPNGDEFGLVFDSSSGPNARYTTLDDLLLSDREGRRAGPSLGRRFRLAQALCTSLLLLHAAGWYHKALSADAIVLKNREGSDEFDITEPRLMGFEYSRPNRADEPSLDTRAGALALDHYTHPEKQDADSTVRFSATHEYYALGMCLVEIGCWRPLSAWSTEFGKFLKGREVSAQHWSDFVLAKVVPPLRTLCGDLYADAACLCIAGDFPAPTWSSGSQDGNGVDARVQKMFFVNVVKRLHLCRA